LAYINSKLLSKKSEILSEEIVRNPYGKEKT
jgi:hypothetical protein